MKLKRLDDSKRTSIKDRVSAGHKKRRRRGPTARTKAVMSLRPEVPKSASDIVALGERVQKLNLRHQRVLYAALQGVAVYAKHLKRSSLAWFIFRRASIWNGAAPEDASRAKALAVLLKLMCGASDAKSGEAKTASFYHVALKALLDDGVPPEKIADELKRREGLRKIVDRVRAEKRAKQVVNDKGKLVFSKTGVTDNDINRYSGTTKPSSSQTKKKTAGNTHDLANRTYVMIRADITKCDGFWSTPVGDVRLAHVVFSNIGKTCEAEIIKIE